MLLLYSIALSFAFTLMIPLFLLRREKYASGFRERLGSYPEFEQDGRRVIWLHCVSVGETNAARPLVDQLLTAFPDHRLVISTTTKTGQDLAQKIFHEKADAVIYFPFDWKFSVRKALAHYKPSIILLMETEIWPRFVHEAKRSGAKVAIVNGRLSERSFKRYSKIRPFIKTVLADVDLALMQGEADSRRIVSLGLDAAKTAVTGNLKFDISTDPNEAELTRFLDLRFEISNNRPLIVAASTHEPEERWLLEAYCSMTAELRPRLLIAPRHPERFDSVAKMAEEFRSDQRCEWREYKIARRSSEQGDSDLTADVLLLDSIGELRSVYPLAEIVFVGGSLIPHGGQSVLEPAAAGKAIVTGPHTHNFADVTKTFLAHNALIQLDKVRSETVPDELFLVFSDLLKTNERRREMGINAASVMKANRGASEKTVEFLKKFFRVNG